MVRQSFAPVDVAEIELLRPKEATARYHVARQTLAEWASRGLIGRIKVGRVTLYPAGDIAELLARGLTPRRVVQLETQAETAVDGWRSDPFWKGAASSAGDRPILATDETPTRR